MVNTIDLKKEKLLNLEDSQSLWKILREDLIIKNVVFQLKLKLVLSQCFSKEYPMLIMTDLHIGKTSILCPSFIDFELKELNIS